MEDIPSQLSALILEEYRVMSFRINYAKDEYEEGSLDPPDEVFSIIAYLRDSKVDIIFSTAGIHLNGENKRPHMHYHIIVKELPSGTFQTANSTHRKRWLAKDDNKGFSFENVSVCFPKKEDPVWQVLSYPYKEGLVCMHPALKKIDKKYNDFLIDYGKNLYQVSLGNRARKDACEERKQKAQDSLYDFCILNKEKFRNYKEMKEFLEDNYLSTLDRSQKPTLNNYRNNVQIVANTLGLFRYCDNF